MSSGDAVDGKFFAGGFGEMEEAADVVVLVEGGKEAFSFGGGELERGKSDGPAKFRDHSAITIDELAECH